MKPDLRDREDATRWAVTSTDRNPNYALHAPIVGRLWRRLGYKSMILVYDHGWEDPVGRIIREEIDKAYDLVMPVTETVGPLGVANTMRFCRLVGACSDEIAPEDKVVMADVDMLVFDKEHFAQHDEPIVIWRFDAKYPQKKGDARILPGQWAFPMCYVQALASIWREWFELTPNDPLTSMRNVLDPKLKRDYCSADETALSGRILTSKYAEGPLVSDPDNIWRQGQLKLIPWDSGRTLIRGNGMFRRAGSKLIDWHTTRPLNAGVVKMLTSELWPEGREWLCQYWGKLT